MTSVEHDTVLFGSQLLQCMSEGLWDLKDTQYSELCKRIFFSFMEVHKTVVQPSTASSVKFSLTILAL